MNVLHPSLQQSVFIAGTDTGVGKTWVATRLIAALVAAGRTVAGFKPVAAGAIATPQGLRNEDALMLAAAANVSLPYELTNPLCLPDATSPHLAARRRGTVLTIAPIEAAFSAIRERTDVVIAEGAGGWLAPLGEPERRGTRGPTMADVATVMGLPVVLVVGIRLGSLNHALLTADAISRTPVPLAGWIANPIDPDFRDVDDYIESLVARLPCPLLWTAPRVILPSQ